MTIERTTTPNRSPVVAASQPGLGEKPNITAQNAVSHADNLQTQPISPTIAQTASPYPPTENAAKTQVEARETLMSAVEELNQQMQRSDRSLEFALDEELNRTIITVRNRETDEVIRQIPEEALLRIAHHLEDLKGLLLDDKI